ncbi:MAG: hypothetical protein ACYDEU_09495 [Vulcanimicrobiaceae bacterium]
MARERGHRHVTGARAALRPPTAFALALLLLLPMGQARAQSLQRLDVTSFTLSSDTGAPQLERPFHLIIAVSVTESESRLDNLVLPSFFGLEELGDARRLVAGSNGTRYRETITVVAHRSGTIHVTPAYLDAVDARNGRPTRFISNALVLHVGGGLEAPAAAARGIFRLLAAGGGIAALLLLAGALLLLLRRPRVRAQQQHEGGPQPARLPPAAAPANRLHAFRERLSTDPERSTVLELRSYLWALAGAGAGETLADVLRRPGAHDLAVRTVLRAAERAAFCPEAHLHRAIGEVLASLEHYMP